MRVGEGRRERGGGVGGCGELQRGRGGWLQACLWGSHNQQHLLWTHQHPLALPWQFHSSGVSLVADGLVSLSAWGLVFNWSSHGSHDPNSHSVAGLSSSATP